MNGERLFTVLPGHHRIRVFGLDDDGSNGLLARPASWPEALALFRGLAARRHPFTLVFAGSSPPDSFLRALAPLLDATVLVPPNWLQSIPEHLHALRAHRAAGLASTHLRRAIETRYFLDDGHPF